MQTTVDNVKELSNMTMQTLLSIQSNQEANIIQALQKHTFRFVAEPALGALAPNIPHDTASIDAEASEVNFRLSRNLSSVEEVWREYYVGINNNKPVVYYEKTYQNKWKLLQVCIILYIYVHRNYHMYAYVNLYIV